MFNFSKYKIINFLTPAHDSIILVIYFYMKYKIFYIINLIYAYIF